LPPSAAEHSPKTKAADSDPLRRLSGASITLYRLDRLMFFSSNERRIF